MPDSVQKRDLGDFESLKPEEKLPPIAPAPDAPASDESEAPEETAVQKLKRENANVDVADEVADVKVQLVSGSDVNIVSVGGKDYDFASEAVQTVTPSEAALLSELESVEVVA